MAKLKAPLLSFGASGQIAKTVVYFPWKGLNVARKHVVPANPDTLDQQTQRGYVRTGVAKIHAAIVRVAFMLADADKSAYSLLGSTRATPRTWFNEAVKNWVDTLVSANEACIFSAGRAVNTLATGAVFEAYLNEKTPSALAAGSFYLGVSKTSLIKVQPATITPGVCISNGANPYTDLVAGVVYYWQFRSTVVAPDIDAMTGIYHFKAT
jgi:hypothetical protein